MYNKKFSKEPTEKQKIGEMGENFACEYLEKNGYKVIERNYLRKWGELDIVTKKGSKLHFVEVKTVSRLLGESGIKAESDVTHVTNKEMRHQDDYRPEDNMHPWKLKRLSRAVQSYLLEKSVSDETDWQFDLVTVYIDHNKRLSRVFLMEDIILA